MLFLLNLRSFDFFFVIGWSLCIFSDMNLQITVVVGESAVIIDSVNFLTFVSDQMSITIALCMYICYRFVEFNVSISWIIF